MPLFDVKMLTFEDSHLRLRDFQTAIDTAYESPVGVLESQHLEIKKWHFSGALPGTFDRSKECRERASLPSFAE
eukprot:3915585-Prymnesium_polylepis.1